MSSDDVIHSLFVPAFRIKQDIVPGRYNYAWFNATKPGEYDLECTEYCGTKHSDMITKVVIHKEGEFETWLAQEKTNLLRMPPVDLGKLLYNERGCSQCHALTGNRRIGPNFEQTYGQNHEFSDGSTALGDENYIRESILNPQEKVRAGFPPTMPTFKGLLEEPEINGLIAFIRSQKPGYKLTPADTEIPKLEGQGAAGQGGAQGQPAPAPNQGETQSQSGGTQDEGQAGQNAAPR
jgi:cytochrome c oxidase subunit 2